MENKEHDSLKTSTNIVGCDTASKITESRLSTILDSQYNQFIGRYLDCLDPANSYKVIDIDEAALISDGNVNIVSLWEMNGTDVSSFTASNGLQHARTAIDKAIALGQHQYSTIYFALELNPDCDPQSFYGVNSIFTDVLDWYMIAVIAVFNSSYNQLSYQVGVYGHYDVCRRYHDLYGCHTMPWAITYNGNNPFTDWNIHQHSPVTLSQGFVVDPDEIKTNTPYGGWRHSFPSSWTYMDSTYHKRTCSSCNFVYKKPHDYPTNWSSYGNSNYHRKVCTASGCGSTKYAAHVVNNWVNYGNAMRHRGTCSLCGQTLYQPHVPNETGTACTVCGYVGTIGGTTKDEN